MAPRKHKKSQRQLLVSHVDAPHTFAISSPKKTGKNPVVLRRSFNRKGYADLCRLVVNHRMSAQGKRIIGHCVVSMLGFKRPFIWHPGSMHVRIANAVGIFNSGSAIQSAAEDFETALLTSIFDVYLPAPCLETHAEQSAMVDSIKSGNEKHPMRALRFASGMLTPQDFFGRMVPERDGIIPAVDQTLAVLKEALDYHRAKNDS